MIMIWTFLPLRTEVSMGPKAALPLSPNESADPAIAAGDLEDRSQGPSPQDLRPAAVVVALGSEVKQSVNGLIVMTKKQESTLRRGQCAR